jgi:hypothetical protein
LFGWKVELENNCDAVRVAAPTLPEPPMACTSIFVRGGAKMVEHDASSAGEPGTKSPSATSRWRINDTPLDKAPAIFFQ